MTKLQKVIQQMKEEKNFYQERINRIDAILKMIEEISKNKERKKSKWNTYGMVIW